MSLSCLKATPCCSLKRLFKLFGSTSSEAVPGSLFHWRPILSLCWFFSQFLNLTELRFCHLSPPLPFLPISSLRIACFPLRSSCMHSYPCLSSAISSNSCSSFNVPSKFLFLNHSSSSLKVTHGCPQVPGPRLDEVPQLWPNAR